MIRLIFLFVCYMVMMLPTASIGESLASIRAGVASMITPVSAVKYYQQIVDYLGEKMGLPAEMIHRTTYEEIDVMLEEGLVDVAFICSSPYVIDNDKFGAELLVAPQVKGKPFYHSDIIVHQESDIKSFDDLQGKTFIFADPKSNTGRLYPTYLLAKKQKTPENFFSSYLYSYSHNKSVELVAKKKVDGAAVDSIVYDFMLANNSPYAKQTRVIHRSPQFGIPPIVVPPGLSPFQKSAMREIFLNMHTDPNGKRILDAMKIDRFIDVPDSNYDSIRAMEAFLANSAHSPSDPIHSVRERPNPESHVIYFGILPRENPRISYERYQPLADYLAKAVDEKIELRLERSYKDVVNSLGRGKTSFALLGPLTYLDAFDRFAAIPIARGITAHDDPFFNSVIVTSNDSTIKQLSELAGKKFAFAALWSTSGNLLPRYMLAWSGIHLNKLGEYKNFNHQETIAKKIISREYDAGAMRISTAEQYLQYGLKILATSAAIPTGPVVAGAETPAPLVRKIQKLLLSMAENEQGRNILRKLDPDLQGGFIATSDADYREIRQMINGVSTTCGIGCHPKRTF